MQRIVDDGNHNAKFFDTPRVIRVNSLRRRALDPLSRMRDLGDDLSTISRSRDQIRVVKPATAESAIFISLLFPAVKNSRLYVTSITELKSKNYVCYYAAKLSLKNN